MWQSFKASAKPAPKKRKTVSKARRKEIEATNKKNTVTAVGKRKTTAKAKPRVKVKATSIQAKRPVKKYTAAQKRVNAARLKKAKARRESILLARSKKAKAKKTVKAKSRGLTSTDKTKKSPVKFNAKLKKASAEGRLTGKFKKAVDASPMKFMGAEAVMNVVSKGKKPRRKPPKAASNRPTPRPKRRNKMNQRPVNRPGRTLWPGSRPGRGITGRAIRTSLMGQAQAAKKRAAAKKRK